MIKQKKRKNLVTMVETFIKNPSKKDIEYHKDDHIILLGSGKNKIHLFEVNNKNVLFDTLKDGETAKFRILYGLSKGELINTVRRPASLLRVEYDAGHDIIKIYKYFYGRMDANLIMAFPSAISLDAYNIYLKFIKDVYNGEL